MSGCRDERYPIGTGFCSMHRISRRTFAEGNRKMFSKIDLKSN